MFRPSSRLSYEVLLRASAPPITEAIEAFLNVPPDFAASVNAGDKIEVFALIETGDAQEEDFSLFELLEGSVYDPTQQTVSFELPGVAFVENAEGDFVAIMTLAPTPGGTTLRRDRRRLQGSTCMAASIRCPVAGGCDVTSPYNRARKHPVTGETRPHYGVDYRAAVGTSVTAAAGGTIERSYLSSSYGNTVIIRHTDGSATLYAHLDSRDVATGDTVSVGDQIGLSGNTGLSSGPHLHFEYVPNGQIIQSKERIDPDACVGDVTSGSITVGDNGSLADDAFQLTLNGVIVGTTTIGGQNNLSVNNLIPGTYSLQLLVIVAPDNVGTWFIQLNDGLTFSNGVTFATGSSAQGATVTFSIIVPAPSN
jgi:murein DD-endopeptidase MepM/ murein hydrolase activator NlpD